MQNKYFTYSVLVVLAILFAGCFTASKDSQNPSLKPRKVEVRQYNGTYRLYVDNSPFYVKGAGLEFGNIQSLAAHGANSFRTWRTDNGKQSAKEVLDEAHKHGLMVLMGLEVGRERHGFDYNDSIWVAKQQDEIRQQVEMIKDHPALLAWGIGNELNLRYTNLKVWKAVDGIARMIHSVDGNHPVTTMLAGISKTEVDAIREYCPNLDFVSLQFYGDIENLPERLADAGYHGPYLITEWGATGHWEVPVTQWNAPIEHSSAEKAAAIQYRYEQIILRDSVNCMGAYVFLWGQKQERTPTWYGLFTEKGDEMDAIDVMHYCWTGQWPKNRTPYIKNATIENKGRNDNVLLKSNQSCIAYVDFIEPDGDSVLIEAEILAEASEVADGGDFEKRPESWSGPMECKPNGTIFFIAPRESGNYRMFIYVRDNQGHSGAINIPFQVE